MQRFQRVSLAGLLGTALWLLGAACAAAAPPTVQVASDLNTKTVRTEESQLADVVADAIRAVDKSDIAFIAASSFTDATIAKGTASSADFVKAVEYPDDTIAIVKLTGAQVKSALEHALSLYPQKNSAFLQVSGITVNIDPAADKGKRVTAIKVGKAALVNDKTYTVAMPAPLANGALAYFKVWAKSDVDHDTSTSLEDSLTTYLKGAKTVGAKGDDRLAFKK